MKFILGKKLRMSQIFTDEGTIPVTIIEAGPLTIAQIKTVENDGYQSVQFASGEKKRISKPLKGHLKKAGISVSPRKLMEFKMEGELKMGEKEIKVGDQINVSIFEEGDTVTVRGISKGKGFQGPVKRYDFRGAPASHGHKHVLRSPGSIGQRFPQHTLKGTRMAGRMGGDTVSIEGLKIVGVDSGKNIILIKGAIPGPNGSFVEIFNR